MLLCKFTGVIHLSDPAALRKGQDTNAVPNRKLSETEENDLIGCCISAENSWDFGSFFMSLQLIVCVASSSPCHLFYFV